MAGAREFVIRVKRPWLLLILPILATLYFAGVVALIALDYRIRGVTNEMLVYSGLGLFAFVILIELPFFMRRRVRAPKPAAPPPAMTEEHAPEEAPIVASARDDELRITSDQHQGMQVAEYSRPAKSSNRNSVYTKTHVQVTSALVLRVETLVADSTEI